MAKYLLFRTISFQLTFRTQPLLRATLSEVLALSLSGFRLTLVPPCGSFVWMWPIWLIFSSAVGGCWVFSFFRGSRASCVSVSVSVSVCRTSLSNFYNKSLGCREDFSSASAIEWISSASLQCFLWAVQSVVHRVSTLSIFYAISQCNSVKIKTLVSTKFKYTIKYRSRKRKLPSSVSNLAILKPNLS